MSQQKEKGKFKAPMPVRQTKASIYRMAKANLLLVSADNKIKVDGKILSLPAAVVRVDTKTSSEDDLNYTSYQSTQSASRYSLCKPKQSLSQTFFPPKLSLNVTKNEITQRISRIDGSKTDLNKRKAVPTKSPIPPVKNEKINNNFSRNTSVRRSLSAQHFQKSKQVKTVPQKIPIMKNKFQSPHKAQFDILEKPLNMWLKKNNKSINHVPTLKVLGFDEEEDKENMEPRTMPRSASYENLNIDLETSECAEKPEKLDDLMLRGILSDIHKIILGGYSVEECEKWLSFVALRYETVKEKPYYWECRAAIEQRRGNYSKARENYNMSLKVSNAQEQQESNSNVLKNLLDKFNLLNIDPQISKKQQSRNLQSKRKVKDADNIFASSLIQFAINEEPTPDKGQFTATPVRRSSRKSRSHFTVTPGKQLCNSMNTLDESTKKSLNFHKNSFL